MTKINTFNKFEVYLGARKDNGAKVYLYGFEMNNEQIQGGEVICYPARFHQKLKEESMYMPLTFKEIFIDVHGKKEHPWGVLGGSDYSCYHLREILDDAQFNGEAWWQIKELYHQFYTYQYTINMLRRGADWGENEPTVFNPALATKLEQHIIEKLIPLINKRLGLVACCLCGKLTVGHNICEECQNGYSQNREKVKKENRLRNAEFVAWINKVRLGGAHSEQSEDEDRFNRAKEACIKRWDDFSNNVWKPDIFGCSFCIMYQEKKGEDKCNACPVYKDLGKKCYKTVWYKQWHNIVLKADALCLPTYLFPNELKEEIREQANIIKTYVKSLTYQE